MDSSRWVELVTHPVTGEQAMLQADTEEELELQIEAWTGSGDTSEKADDKVTTGASAS